VLAAFQQQLTHFSAQPVVSVDTTGAGDALSPGCSPALPPRDADGSAALEPTLTLAQTCGALATTAKGAMTALPYQHDLNSHFDPFGPSGGPLCCIHHIY
jgi:fructokinase